jgi:flavodoxin
VARSVSTAEARKGREVKIGIIVYSMTGHTLAVATRLQEALSAAGHTYISNHCASPGR